MNASEITFGIEIETTIPANTLTIGSYGHGQPIPQLPGWTAARDGSIRSGRGRVGCEFVSPVLKGAEGVESIIAAVAFIKSIGGTVNQTCGLHVHVGFNKSDAIATAKLTTLVANVEKAIYASTGTHSRERGDYCRPIQRYGNAVDATRYARADRYHVCNLATVKPTVEFRAFAGTLNESKIIAHVMMAVGLVERSLKAARVTNWTAKPVSPTSPIARKGEGQTALNRLFYQLGWTKGRTDYTYGNVAGAPVTVVTRAKRTLMKLARKYDGSTR
ncbi:MAG TPA: amidoligase family protein [Tepidisphaeraceae bacterium]|jgi:hypothetical protein|nr:amidoligase family protein [Tepidisphaeraceae bacterium]